MTAWQRLSCLIIVLMPGAAFADNQAVMPSSSHADVTVIENVTVLPMDRPDVLKDYLVEVQGATITYVGPKDHYHDSAGARHIDGNGGYLMPGLADMHMHILNDRSAPAVLGHYLSYGVTTVRALSGDPSLLDLRNRIADGRLLGPRLWVSGPIIIGLSDDTIYGRISRSISAGAGFLMVFTILLWMRRKSGLPLNRRFFAGIMTASVGAAALLWFWRPIDLKYDLHNLMGGQKFTANTAEKAIDEVDRQAAAGYDLVKVYDLLRGDVYSAAVREARRRNMYVTGHLPDAVPLEKVLSSGLQEVAHADELTSYHWIGYNPNDDDWSDKLLTFKMNYSTIPQTIALLKANNLTVVSNLVTDETIYRLIHNPDAVLAGPEYRAVGQETRDAWKGGRVARWKNQYDFRHNVIQPFLRTLVKAMADNGIMLLVGTDVTVEGMMPGYHLVRDVELLQEAGVPPYDALRAATVNAAIVSGRMGKNPGWGSIIVGNRADLLLLRSNPFDTVSNLYTAAGVMVNGRWLDVRALKKMREQKIDIQPIGE